MPQLHPEARAHLVLLLPSLCWDVGFGSFLVGLRPGRARRPKQKNSVLAIVRRSLQTTRERGLSLHDKTGALLSTSVNLSCSLQSLCMQFKMLKVPLSPSATAYITCTFKPKTMAPSTSWDCVQQGRMAPTSVHRCLTENPHCRNLLHGENVQSQQRPCDSSTVSG